MIIISLVTNDLTFPVYVHFSCDHDVLLSISESIFSCILFYTPLKHTLAILCLGGKLAFLLLYTLLKINDLAILLQRVSWPGA